MLQRVRGLVAALCAALVLTMGVGSATLAGSEAGGDVTFRLVLRGDVVAGDAFSLGVNADNGVIISPGIRCGPGSELYTAQFTACTQGTFDFVVDGRGALPVGTELTYTWARIHGESNDTVIYTDTVTITEIPQVLTVVYDYGGGTLPDTAMASSSGAFALGVALLVASLLAADSKKRRRVGEG